MAYGKFFHLWIRRTKSKMNLSLKAYGKNDSKPKINWDNRKEREELLSILVSDVKEVLSHIDVDKEDLDSELKDVTNCLAKIVSQDIEKDKEDKPKIKKGVTKDRIISTTDPEMRHGRKSSSGKFNGHKTHITKDVSSEIITNIDVSSRNCPDQEMAESLIDEAKEEFKVKTRSLTGDGAYGSPDTQKKMSDREIELISKVLVAKNSGKLSKEEFSIDLENEKVVCPEGKVAIKCYQRKNSEGEITKTFIFPKEICQLCSAKNECTNAKNTGRTIRVGPNEKYLQKAREIQKTEGFKEIYNKILSTRRKKDS